MPTSFNTEHAPFNLLTENQKKLLRDSLDIGYFDKKEVILEAGQPSDYVYVILKGDVAETDDHFSGNFEEEDEGFVAHYDNEELFGAITIINGSSRHTFTALEETISYLIPKATFLTLIEQNEDFSAFFKRTLAEKTRHLLSRQSDSDYDSSTFMLAQIDETCMRQPLVLASGSTIKEATQALKDHHADSLLVDRDGQYGMITKTDLLDAVVLKGLTLGSNIADLAHYKLLTVAPGDFLFNALVLMTRHKIERVVVQDEQQRLHGVVELVDVLSFFSNQSHVIGLQIEKASNLKELARAANGLNDLVRSLVSHGVKINFAMDLLAALNARIIGKVFDFLIPEEVRHKVCMLVLGSEGRGEQVLKTDQDNAIILSDDLVWPDRQKVLQQITDTLVSFGYPLCPGNIMVSNPMWVLTETQWKHQLVEWANTTNGEAQMNLAIFADAHVIAGDRGMFKKVRDFMFAHLAGNDVFYSYFASPIMRFSTPLTMFGSIKDSSKGIDIKKGGIFPIVHGIRTMALENRIKATNTFDRINALVEKKVLKKSFAENLSEALGLFVSLRLKQQLKTLAEGSEAEDANHIFISDMTKLDKEFFRDALHVVKDFKSRLSNRYRLER
ncbi:CBS domain-containing protein [Oceanospirillum multiglobuliferum]|uniref:Cyclic nucleotide-binding protein n=1 Tax=Oceanospirillum multiglobuliferum TaxID=64969 RepID=A0A1T4L940_9GAMM|nr:putative nucleotidyltransferase substrate binding domain-containing protein [Oceanospirillum multiglobuliferum]OPX56746.1 cyclic nucleotide-binding protein [Oceanospirillum multiglobuliferum]SJZ51292.1 CBS domain-containing protein [Oceanospirillum multiglobuliferum]